MLEISGIALFFNQRFIFKKPGVDKNERSTKKTTLYLVYCITLSVR